MNENDVFAPDMLNWGYIWAFIIGAIVAALVCCYDDSGMRALENCQSQNARLEAILDDPHHCISICADEFKKMGC